jgi:hypothetical protein
MNYELLGKLSQWNQLTHCFLAKDSFVGGVLTMSHHPIPYEKGKQRGQRDRVEEGMQRVWGHPVAPWQ